MTDKSSPIDVRSASLTERALAILAVDGIKVSARARELLDKCEAGEMTFAQAREDVIARAKAMAAKQKKHPNTK